jgi:hypothetical protein
MGQGHCDGNDSLQSGAIDSVGQSSPTVHISQDPVNDSLDCASTSSIVFIILYPTIVCHFQSDHPGAAPTYRLLRTL